MTNIHFFTESGLISDQPFGDAYGPIENNEEHESAMLHFNQE